MKWRIQNQFLANYLLMFFISIMLGVFALMLSGFANDVLSKTLVKNHYTAQSLMQNDYRHIDITPVIKNGGGIQIINREYEIEFSAGLNTFAKNKLTTAEFTEFLTKSKSISTPYSIDVSYNAQEQFWLVVTFPTSIRIDFAIVHNQEYPSVDMQNVVGAFVAIILFYLLSLAAMTVIYSKITSWGIVNPLKQLSISARRLRDGDYSARVDLHLQNEFAELQDTFNAMAEQIQLEILLRKESEENRKQLILDISHDLKNPLASVMGYAELCKNHQALSTEEQDAYLGIIYENSVRANNLITDLFELSKMESSEFVLHLDSVDVCEYVREQMGKSISTFDQAGFSYEFDIPEEEIYGMLDTKQMARVFQNLIANAVQYNPAGTKITVQVLVQDDQVVIIFRDNGVGISTETAKNIFLPFVRADQTRNSCTGGTGLGLAIVEKIISAHQGKIDLITAENQGCEFVIRIPNKG